MWCREDCCRYCLPMDFKEDFLNWDNYQNSMLGTYLTYFFPAGHVDIMMKFFGSILVPYFNHQQVLIIVGKAGAGKSSLMDCLKNTLGLENISTLGWNEFSDRFKISLLRNSLLNIGDEIENNDVSRKMTSALFKKIGSGETMQVEEKYQDPIPFLPIYKSLFTMNELPSMNVDDGVERRCLFVETVKNPQKSNNNFRNEMGNQVEAMVSFMLAGVKWFLGRNFEDKIDPDKNLVKRFVKESESTIDLFVQDCLDIETNAEKQNEFHP